MTDRTVANMPAGMNEHDTVYRWVWLSGKYRKVSSGDPETVWSETGLEFGYEFVSADQEGKVALWKNFE